MNQMNDKLMQLYAEILSEDEATRHRLQPRLAAMIDALSAEGVHVPKRIKDLNEDLVNDAIEAQFDNIPL
jgi:hypothetical protein